MPRELFMRRLMFPLSNENRNVDLWKVSGSDFAYKMHCGIRLCVCVCKLGLLDSLITNIKIAAHTRFVCVCVNWAFLTDWSQMSKSYTAFKGRLFQNYFYFVLSVVYRAPVGVPLLRICVSRFDAPSLSLAISFRSLLVSLLIREARAWESTLFRIAKH